MFVTFIYYSIKTFHSFTSPTRPLMTTAEEAIALQQKRLGDFSFPPAVETDEMFDAVMDVVKCIKVEKKMVGFCSHASCSWR